MVMLNNDYLTGKEYPRKKTLGEKLVSIFGHHGINQKETKAAAREFVIVFKKKYIKNYLMPVKGWKTYTEVARNYRKTRQYMNMLDNQIVPVSGEIIAITANLTGSIEGNWQQPFEILYCGEALNINSQKFNMAKYRGEVPYCKNSIAAAMREQDYEVEKL